MAHGTRQGVLEVVDVGGRGSTHTHTHLDGPVVAEEFIAPPPNRPNTLHSLQSIHNGTTSWVGEQGTSVWMGRVGGWDTRTERVVPQCRCCKLGVG
jgi:hypothetical protein